MSRPFPRTAFIQGYLQQLPHTQNSSYWLIVLWRPSFSVSGRFLPPGRFICEEKMGKKGECVCTSATSLCLPDSHRERKMLAVLFITASYINILLKAVRCVCCIFIWRICRLIEQSLAWYLQWYLGSCQMYNLCHGLVHKTSYVFHVSISIYLFIQTVPIIDSFLWYCKLGTVANMPELVAERCLWENKVPRAWK